MARGQSRAHRAVGSARPIPGTRDRRASLAAPGGGASRFFGARLRYSYELASTPVVQDPEGWLPSSIDSASPWPVDFWMGGWDADVLCGFCWGQLRLPATTDAADERSGAPLRVTDRRP